MASWRPARASIKLREQIDALAPNRDKSNDGTKGDDAHAARKSDHNPNAAGVVIAIDITHDPKHGVDTYELADILKARRDPRIQYVISNHRIWNNDVHPFDWRPYTGPNPHDHHVHVSMRPEPKFYDDDSKPFAIGAMTPNPLAPTVVARRVLKYGDDGPEVVRLQSLLNMHETTMSLAPDTRGTLKKFWDGMVGNTPQASAQRAIFGVDTQRAVKNFQKSVGLVDDGIVGPYTWDAIEKVAAPGKPAPSTAAPAVAAKPTGKFYSLIPGGYFCDTPNDMSIPTSMRCNNPGAINTASWISVLPGYVDARETTPGNHTAVFRSPEEGVAAWWKLMERYAASGADTVGEIVHKYGGTGQDYTAYANFVSKRTGLDMDHKLPLTGNDPVLLKFAKAMFRYEAGRETPLSDVQILYGFRLARKEVT